MDRIFSHLFGLASGIGLMAALIMWHAPDLRLSDDCAPLIKESSIPYKRKP